MDRTGLSDAAVLCALYNVAKPLGMGFMHYDPTPLTIAGAEKLLKRGDDVTAMFGKTDRGGYFDYLKGRVMKVDVSANPLNLSLFDRDNGKGVGEAAIMALKRAR